MTRMLASIVLTLSMLGAEAARLDAQPLFSATSADQSNAISAGVLVQAQVQLTDVAGKQIDVDNFLRRLRFIGGGRVAKKLKFFVESDTPNMGSQQYDGRMAPTFLQDLILTAEITPNFNIDGGLLMVPVSYNTTQSAASLLTVGYGPYSFVASTPTHSRVGRDQGVQARGYAARNRLEYRAGVYRGASKHGRDLPLRYSGRVACAPAGAQRGFFYPGTLHGKRYVSIGASWDQQQSYRAYGADLFSEWPLATRDVLTVQADVVRYDGGDTFKELSPQHTWLVETGYQFRAARVGLFAQASTKRLVEPAKPDATAWQGGVAYWWRDHRVNVKAGAGRAHTRGTAAATQAVVQMQVFVF